MKTTLARLWSYELAISRLMVARVKSLLLKNVWGTFLVLGISAFGIAASPDKVASLAVSFAALFFLALLYRTTIAAELYEDTAKRRESRKLGEQLQSLLVESANLLQFNTEPGVGRANWVTTYDDWNARLNEVVKQLPRVESASYETHLLLDVTRYEYLDDMDERYRLARFILEHRIEKLRRMMDRAFRRAEPIGE